MLFKIGMKNKDLFGANGFGRWCMYEFLLENKERYGLDEKDLEIKQKQPALRKYNIKLVNGVLFNEFVGIDRLAQKIKADTGEQLVTIKGVLNKINIKEEHLSMGFCKAAKILIGNYYIYKKENDLFYCVMEEQEWDSNKGELMEKGTNVTTYEIEWRMHELDNKFKISAEAAKGMTVVKDKLIDEKRIILKEDLDEIGGEDWILFKRGLI